MGCSQTKSQSMISKKIPISILKKPGFQKEQTNLTNSEEIEKITKKVYNDEQFSYNCTQNPILRRRQLTCSCD